jgi:hypothetical protein
MSELPTAKLTTRNIAKLSRGQRRSVVVWLRKQAAFIEKDSTKLAPRYSAGIYFTPK